MCTDISGTNAVENQDYGILILNNCNDNIVGGATSSARNIVSGNGDNGIRVENSSGNQVLGNFIGTDVSGAAALGNKKAGVSISQADSNIIGNAQPGMGNLISGNNTVGIFIYGENSTGNMIQGNFIGTDSTGSAGNGNQSSGIYINHAPGNTIGGLIPGTGNIISDNRGTGIRISAGGSIGNTVQGNFIGTDITGTQPLGNLYGGINVTWAFNTVIGGTEPGAGNIIAFNQFGGVIINDFSLDRFATENRILSNRIFANSFIGIDLGWDGVTPNDIGDNDIGNNYLQNFPEVTLVFQDADDTRISALLNSHHDIPHGFLCQTMEHQAGPD